MVVVFVAVHGVKVAAPLIGVAYLFAVGVGHGQHSSPAVVLVIHGEAELLVAVGQDDGAGLSCDIAQRVIREFMAPRAVADMDGTPFGGAAGAVCVCHIVSRHVAITFSISRAQRANHAVFVLCRGEKTSCNNVCSAPCSMCSRKKIPQVDSAPLPDCPRLPWEYWQVRIANPVILLGWISNPAQREQQGDTEHLSRWIHLHELLWNIIPSIKVRRHHQLIINNIIGYIYWFSIIPIYFFKQGNLIITTM